MTDTTLEQADLWSTDLLDPPQTDSYLFDLSWNGTALFVTITVDPPPSPRVVLTSSDTRNSRITVLGGRTRTVDDLVLAVETSPDNLFKWQVRSPSTSTRNGGTTTSKRPRTTRTPRPKPIQTGTSKPGIGGGAIAGIAIGGIVVLALIIGGWYFWRRKKRRAQPPTTTLTDDELARREGDCDKMVLDTDHNATRTGADQTEYQEMSGNGLTQELNRSHSYKYAIGGAHELRAEDRPGELPYNGMEEHGRISENREVGVDNEGDGRNVETLPVPGADNPTSQVSPHVEAQRKREVEWLEMEETRMRQRREALLQQGGAKTQ